MGNPVLTFWHRLFAEPHRAPHHADPRTRPSVPSATQASATIFLVLRRMRTPLIVLIVIFAVSVFGLTLIPGREETGQPWRMGFFEAFYFMSYTATTIGFGELPHEFTDAQRMWVTLAIYLTVIGWAYAIGSLLALMQDSGFRQALALQRFTRKVDRMREPFLLIAGYGQTGEIIGRSLDAVGRRFVVVDQVGDRVNALEIEAYGADVPALVGDVRNPAHLWVAGLGSRWCEGVLALTDDDEANLAVTMAAALLRPELTVIARTVSPAIAHRMHAFGTPVVINPFDRFGDQLRISLRLPAVYQLITWLTSVAGGTPLPPRRQPPSQGRWVVCGHGRFGRELIADLRTEGLEVTVVAPGGADATDEASIIVGDATEPAVMMRAHVEQAVGFVAGTDSDTANLSLIVNARRTNPKLFLVARQNDPRNKPLFAAMGIDSVLVQTEVVGREVLARLGSPLLWRFIEAVSMQEDPWAARLVERLTLRCGERAPVVWQVRLDEAEAPTLTSWLSSGAAHLGDLLRNPEERERPLAVVPLMLLRGDEHVLAPDDDLVLAPDDHLLLAGRPPARHAFTTTLLVDAAGAYVTSGQRAPSGWLWRRFARDTKEPIGR